MKKRIKGESWFVFTKSQGKHHLLTGDEDAPLAMLLALSNKKESKIDAEVEELLTFLLIINYVMLMD